MHERISRDGRRVTGFRFEGLSLGVDGPSSLIIAASKRPLDANLPQDVEDAVFAALHQETDPAKLRAFAQTLLPNYPTAASVLNARAAKLAVETAAFGVGFKFQPWKGLAKIAKDAVKVGPIAFIPGAGAAAILAVGAVEAGHTKAGKKIGADLAKNKVLSGIAKAYQSTYQQANPAFFAKTLILGASDELLHGKNLGKALTDEFKKTGQYFADKGKLAGNVAGVPPQVTSAMTAAGQLAEGKPLPKDLLSAAGAVVGAAAGPAATAALQQGAAYGNQLAQGATGPLLTQIAAAKSALPPAVTHAFDSGLAIQTAQHLQDKGYAAAHALLPPDATGSLAGKVVTALNAPTKDLLSAAIKDVKQSLPPGAADLAHRTAAAIVTQPQLAHLSSHELARKLGIHESVARVALASVSHEVPGAPLVHAHRLEHLVGRPSPPVLPTGGQDPSVQWVAYYAALMPPDTTAPPAAASYEPYPTVAQ